MKTGAVAAEAALVTIVSANYVPAARVLCRSFAAHHPEARRFVVIVDRPVATAVSRDEPFEAIDVADVGIPHLEDMLAQYTVLEANTAVKPFVLKHLFERYGVDSVVYLDPDIWVMAPLDAVFDALARAPIALTPHLQEPFRDDARPREIDILRSGTYNLGFIALRRSAAALALLDWWAEKTECDCVVDFANGIFVDQKWMDLVPGYFPDTALVAHPGYNTAYWNLHERELTLESGRYFARGEPLAFFHFSGFDPDHPTRLSKHQDRHDLRGMPALRSLCAAYRDRLLAEGYAEARTRKYGFSRLANGIPISKVMRSLVRHCRKEGIAFPSVRDPEAFCRFLMTPNPLVTGRDLSPFVHAVLQTRKDVSAVYPRCVDDAEDPGFLHWLRNSAHEVDSRELHDRYRVHLTRVNPFVRVQRMYERRPDLRSAFPDAFRTVDGLRPFATWLRVHGTVEEDLTEEEVQAFVDGGLRGFERVVEHYFATPGLATSFPTALFPWANAEFFDWMLRHGTRLAGISLTALSWFEHRAGQMDPASLVLLTALRSSFFRAQFPLGTTVLGWKDLCRWVRADAVEKGGRPPELPPDPPERIEGIFQLEVLHATSTLHRGASQALRTREGARRLLDAVVMPLNERLTDEHRSRLFDAVAAHSPARGVNVAGHFNYAAGAGVAALSLVRALDAVGIAHQDVTLPLCPSEMSALESASDGVPERFWTTHRPDFEVSITVANADVMPAARAYLGPTYDRGRKHVAYWVWETPALPGQYAAAAEGLDAIWTPSVFSANALRRTLGDTSPIHVVPYAIPAGVPVDPRPLPVSLPEDRTLFGFFFDARSVIERKNPAALLRAFRRAFRADDRAALVLKVSHGRSAPKEMAELERLADGLPVIWLRDVRLDEHQVAALLSRLTAYVSLHRAEGFGLVLAETMALGKPVIATRYSGNTEFMDDSCARLVGCEEITTERSFGPYPRGTRWAEVDLDDAAAALRSLHDDADLRRELGDAARLRIERTLAPWIIGERVSELLAWRGDGAQSSPPAQIREEVASPSAVRPRDLGSEATPPRGSVREGRLWPAE